MKTPNLKKEIQVLILKLENDDYAQAFYAALCNIEWKKVGTDYSYGGMLVVGMRHQGKSYLDFYCSGQEGVVRPDIEKDLNNLEYIKI